MMRVSGNRNMRPAGKACAGFSLLELAIATVIALVLIVLSLKRINSYQAEAEQAAALQTASVLRGALNLRIANLLASDKRAEIAKLADQNPMDWLDDRPKNYLGVFYAPKATDIAEGNWYYDKNNKTLVYLLNKGKFSRANEWKQLNFKAKLVHNGNSSTKKIDGINTDEIDGVVLEQIDR